MVTLDWGDFVYAPPSCRRGRFIELPESEATHLFRVLRGRTGESIRCTDGAGMVYDCKITHDKKLEIWEEHPEQGESLMKVTLCVAELKSKMDKEVVDTATQLGASEIIFFHGGRSEGRQQEDKLEKLEQTVITAVKQCGRSRLPKLTLEKNLQTLLEKLPREGLRLIAHPLKGAAIHTADSHAHSFDSATLIVGPEGGFTYHEVEAAVDKGFHPLLLSQRRLRAEAAVAAGLCYLRSISGEFGYAK